jgi:hypothetical protein
MTYPNYRLYAFVANHYLSQLQLGLQTAHVVGSMSVKYDDDSREDGAFRIWAAQDKTIIILGAGNHQGVIDCYTEITRTNTMALPRAIFYEDEESMNDMATACGVVVPEKYWNVKFFQEADTFDQFGMLVKHTDAYWEHGLPDGQMVRYPLTHPEGQFISHIKSFRMA